MEMIISTTMLCGRREHWRGMTSKGFRRWWNQFLSSLKRWRPSNKLQRVHFLTGMIAAAAAATAAAAAAAAATATATAMIMILVWILDCIREWFKRRRTKSNQKISYRILSVEFQKMYQLCVVPNHILPISSGREWYQYHCSHSENPSMSFDDHSLGFRNTRW